LDLAVNHGKPAVILEWRQGNALTEPGYGLFSEFRADSGPTVHNPKSEICELKLDECLGCYALLEVEIAASLVGIMK
jgi:hypothetical protein